MNILCLTGWQQPVDALQNIALEANHFDYASYTDIQLVLQALPKTPDLAIGWSLGGQILVRAVAEGHIKPKALLLLAAPFQCIASAHFPKGAQREILEEFRDNYLKNPQAALRQFHILLTLGDFYAPLIAAELNNTVTMWQNGTYWFDELMAFSCRNSDFSRFPPTTIIHGMQDKVIDPANAEAFTGHIPGAQLLLWPGCAHFPHLHDAPAVLACVQKYV